MRNSNSPIKVDNNIVIEGDAMNSIAIGMAIVGNTIDVAVAVAVAVAMGTAIVCDNTIGGAVAVDITINIVATLHFLSLSLSLLITLCGF